MTDKKFFNPEIKVLHQLSQKERWQLKYVIRGNITFIIGFILVGIALILQKESLTGTLSIATSICFILSLILIKRGRVHTGAFLSTIGIIFATFIILFFAGDVSSSLIFYRSACFVVVMALCNQLVSLSKKQLRTYTITSQLLWTVSSIMLFPHHLELNKAGTIAGFIICSVAIIVTLIIINHLSNFNGIIVTKAEKARNDAENHLSSITKVIDESKNGLEVGQKLYDATQNATCSINELYSIYESISLDSTGLSQQTQTISQSSTQVKNQAEMMKASVQQQNNAITETSSAMSQISSNLSSMSKIADRRRSNMTEVLKNLDSQLKLINTLEQDVLQVQESSNGIAGFVQTVDKIATQTGLLAMNASIEAAHAGEAGKGFKVIALSIRKLSEQTTQNAAQIDSELEKNTQLVENTTASFKAFEQFTKTTTSELKETMTAIEEILAGIQEMNQGTQDVMASLQEIVEQAKSTGTIVDSVVQEFNLQDSALEKISSFAIQMQERVSGMDLQLKNIQSVITSIKSESEENISVTKKITQTLNSSDKA